MKYRKDDKSKPIPVLLDQALRDRIEAVSKRMGEAKSTVMRIAMRLGLDTIEQALVIKPSILKVLAEDSRDPENYPPHTPQHSGMNEPRDSSTPPPAGSTPSATTDEQVRKLGRTLPKPKRNRPSGSES